MINSLSRRAGQQQSTRNAGILPAMGRVRTPALPASAALPYSSNSYLLTPNSSSPRPRRAASVNPLFVVRCSLLVERHQPRRRRAAAFSLVEILIAIFVLSLGLIMIAAIFPVAAKWTAEDAQTSVAQVIAKNAVATIETMEAGATITSATALGPYCYNFGNSSPYPNANPAPVPLNTASAVPPAGSYYWSAYIAPASSTATNAGSGGVDPGPTGGPAGTQGNNFYTIYVFVFNKGDLSNQFATPISGAPAKVGKSALLPMLPVAQNPYGTSFYPQLFYDSFADLASYAASPPPDQPYMPIGSLGVDLTTGCVFRLITDANGNIVPTNWQGGSVLPAGTPTPTIDSSTDTILFAPPAATETGSVVIGGTGPTYSFGTSSPLIYVYVTTVNL